MVFAFVLHIFDYNTLVIKKTDLPFEIILIVLEYCEQALLFHHDDQKPKKGTN